MKHAGNNRAEAAAIDRLISTWTENIFIWFRLQAPGIGWSALWCDLCLLVLTGAVWEYFVCHISHWTATYCCCVSDAGIIRGATTADRSDTSRRTKCHCRWSVCCSTTAACVSYSESLIDLNSSNMCCCIVLLLWHCWFDDRKGIRPLINSVTFSYVFSFLTSGQTWTNSGKKPINQRKCCSSSNSRIHRMSVIYISEHGSEALDVMMLRYLCSQFDLHLVATWCTE